MSLVFNAVVETCDSTNTLARALGEAGFPHGTWISALRQEAGRGRQGRRWESREGNLFFSMVSRKPDRVLWTWVPLAAAIAAAEAIGEMRGREGLRIKWPNDLWLDHSKAGGILCEAVGSFLVIGIGLNCASAPEVAGQKTASLGIDADALRPRLVAALLRQLSELDLSGNGKLAESYERSAEFPLGTEVQWGSPVRSGIVLGLGASSELRVRTSEGEELGLFAEDVSVRAYPKSLI